MKRIRVKEGDIFFIDDIILDEILSFEKKHRIGKLIYISSEFKGMIGFIPSKETFQKIPSDIDSIDFMNKVIYTDKYLLQNGNWPIIGYKDVTEKEILLTERRVANVVMIKDYEVRMCTEEDYRNYANQGIAGFGAVHYILMNL